jgi:hypothetical protein
VWGTIGVSPRAGVIILECPGRVAALGARCCPNPRSWFLSCTKGDLMLLDGGSHGFVLGIFRQLGSNRFESTSLPVSEKLDGHISIVVTLNDLMVQK